ncbi:MAG: T9SS type A sorting domain-containing protein, partial [Bacteroidales bacterium]|jgi:hypothetical protein
MNFDVDSMIKEFNFPNYDSMFPDLKNNHIIIKSYKDDKKTGRDSMLENNPDMEMQLYGRNDKGQNVVYKKKIVIQDMGINDTKANSDALQIEVFPNPADSYFNISFQLDPEHETLVTITDTGGKVLLKETMEESGGLYTRQFDLSLYKSGTYFVNVKQGKKEITKRIVVE